MADRRLERNAMIVLLTGLLILGFVITATMAFGSEGDREGDPTPQSTHPTPILTMTPLFG